MKIDLIFILIQCGYQINRMAIARSERSNWKGVLNEIVQEENTLKY